MIGRELAYPNLHADWRRDNRRRGVRIGRCKRNRARGDREVEFLGRCDRGNEQHGDDTRAPHGSWRAQRVGQRCRVGAGGVRPEILKHQCLRSGAATGSGPRAYRDRRSRAQRAGDEPGARARPCDGARGDRVQSRSQRSVRLNGQSTCDPRVARALVVIVSGPPSAFTCGTASGSASGNETLVDDTVRFARVPTFTEIVALLVCDWAATGVAASTAQSHTNTSQTTTSTHPDHPAELSVRERSACR